MSNFNTFSCHGAEACFSNVRTISCERSNSPEYIAQLTIIKIYNSQSSVVSNVYTLCNVWFRFLVLIHMWLPDYTYGTPVPLFYNMWTTVSTSCCIAWVDGASGQSSKPSFVADDLSRRHNKQGQHDYKKQPLPPQMPTKYEQKILTIAWKQQTWSTRLQETVSPSSNANKIGAENNNNNQGEHFCLLQERHAF